MKFTKKSIWTKIGSKFLLKIRILLKQYIEFHSDVSVHQYTHVAEIFKIIKMSFFNSLSADANGYDVSFANDWYKLKQKMAKLTETHPATGLRVSVHMTYACVTQVECVAYWNRCSRLAHAFMDFNGWAVQESFFSWLFKLAPKDKFLAAAQHSMDP